MTFSDTSDWLETQLARLTSHDDWLALLRVSQKFPRYSFQNQCLIALQRPDASYVAGFRTWHEWGRHVKKGEHGIKILAPIVKKQASRQDLDETTAVVGFRLITVFDMSQTEGRELPLPQLLTGGDPAHWRERLCAVSPVPIAFVPARDLRGANGDYHRQTQQIRVRNDVDPAQQVKTLVHELAHHIGCATELVLDRAWEECAAESTAFVFCGLLGLDTIAYSAAYVAGWAEADATRIPPLMATVQARLKALRALVPDVTGESLASTTKKKDVS